MTKLIVISTFPGLQNTREGKRKKAWPDQKVTQQILRRLRCLDRTEELTLNSDPFEPELESKHNLSPKYCTRNQIRNRDLNDWKSEPTLDLRSISFPPTQIQQNRDMQQNSLPFTSPNLPENRKFRPIFTESDKIATCNKTSVSPETR